MLHVVSEISAVPALYLPCEHREQGADPLTSLYLPLTHGSHAAPSGPVCPKLQVQMLLPGNESECMGQFVQLSSDVWPVLELYLPLGHRRHALEPFTSLYFPFPQATQSWPSGPVYPKLQVHSLTAPLPSAEYECAGHALHVASDT